eukprot:4729626-Amphidinium_carterae.1
MQQQDVKADNTQGASTRAALPPSEMATSAKVSSVHPEHVAAAILPRDGRFQHCAYAFGYLHSQLIICLAIAKTTAGKRPRTQQHAIRS